MTEIFVSTGTAQGKALSIARELFMNGFNKIELSGGDHDKSWLEKMQVLSSLGAEIALHNYFPPPPNAFVLNLGHWNDETRGLSKEMAKTALKVSNSLGAKRYAVHAPFAVDLQAKYLGQAIPYHQIKPRELVEEIFLDSIRELRVESEKQGVGLYIENSPLSLENLNSLGEGAILGVTARQITSLAEKANVGVLVDFGHLNASANSLGLSKLKEAETMLDYSDYVHLSENNGLEDQHLNFGEEAWFIPILRKHKTKIAAATLETGIATLDQVRQSQLQVQEAFS